MAGEEIEVDEKIPEEKRLMSKPAYQRFTLRLAPGVDADTLQVRHLAECFR